MLDLGLMANLNGYIRWLKARLAGIRPADIVRAS